MSDQQRDRDAMTRVHWEFKNHFAHYGGSGTNMLGYRAALDDRHQGAFLFDDEARRRTDEALLQELPGRIGAFADGVRLSEFAAHIANETPAHNGILLSSVGQLLEAREVEVIGRHGEVRRAAGAVRMTDRIRLPA